MALAMIRSGERALTGRPCVMHRPSGPSTTMGEMRRCAQLILALCTADLAMQAGCLLGLLMACVAGASQYMLAAVAAVPALHGMSVLPQ